MCHPYWNSTPIRWLERKFSSGIISRCTCYQRNTVDAMATKQDSLHSTEIVHHRCHLVSPLSGCNKASGTHSCIFFQGGGSGLAGMSLRRGPHQAECAFSRERISVRHTTFTTPLVSETQCREMKLEFCTMRERAVARRTTLDTTLKLTRPTENKKSCIVRF